MVVETASSGGWARRSSLLDSCSHTSPAILGFLAAASAKVTSYTHDAKMQRVQLLRRSSPSASFPDRPIADSVPLAPLSLQALRPAVLSLWLRLGPSIQQQPSASGQIKISPSTASPSIPTPATAQPPSPPSIILVGPTASPARSTLSATLNPPTPRRRPRSCYTHASHATFRSIS